MSKAKADFQGTWRVVEPLRRVRDVINLIGNLLPPAGWPIRIAAFRDKELKLMVQNVLEFLW